MPESDELQKLLAELEKDFKLEFEPLDIDGRHLEILNIANMTEHLDRLLACRSCSGVP